MFELLDKIETDLYRLSLEITNSKDTSNLFFSQKRKEAIKLYEKARKAFEIYTTKELTGKMKSDLQSQIKKIKNMAFTPKKAVNYRSFVNSDMSKQIAGSVISNAISDYDIAVNNGEKKLNKLLTVTQQLNTQEKSLEKAIAEGWDKGLYGVTKKIQEKLQKDLKAGKALVVIDRNGKQINYGIKSYAKLIARTKTAQIQTEGTTNLALAYGSDLVQVSAHNTETPYDAQFEGRIFSLSGQDPDFPVVEDLPPFHPNCRHRISVFFKEAQKPEYIEKMSEYSKGKTQKHPYRDLLPNDDIKARKELK